MGRASYASSDSHRRKQVHYGDDLCTSNRHGRLSNQRDRIASRAHNLIGI